MYVFDLEADGLLDSVTKIHCGVFIHTKTQHEVIFGPDQIPQMLEFMDSQPILCGHNVLGYDFRALEKLYGYEYKGKKIDTLVMSRLLCPNQRHHPQMLVDYKVAKVQAAMDGRTMKLSGPHSVENWAYWLGGESKVEHYDWSTFSADMLNRCIVDVKIQVKILKHLRDKMTEVSWPKESMEVTFKCFDILGKMEQHGWLVDQDLLNRSISLLDHWMGRIDRIVNPILPTIVECQEGKANGVVNWVRKPFVKSGKYAAITLRTFPELEGLTAKEGVVGGPFSRIQFRRVNIDSRNELVDYLISMGWQPAEYNFQKDSDGKPVRDHKGNLIATTPKLNHKDPFIGVEGFVGQMIVKRIQCRHRRSQMEGFRNMIREDGRISQRITDIAATGRLQHGGIVNVPGARSFFGKRMRSIFIAPKGYRIVGTDSVSCQDRMLAARANDDAFTAMLINGDKDKGTDGHSMNMHAINNKFKANKLSFEVTRDTSKNLGYGWKFGASDKKLASTANVPEKYGELIREALSEVSQAQAELVERLTKEWESTAQVRMGSFGRTELYNGVVRGLDGRPVVIEHKHTILVYVLQSDEAIMMQLAKVLLHERLQELGWQWGRDYAFVANIHDEYQAEVRDELVPAYAKMAERSIVKASEILKCPVLAAGDSQIGNNWYETH